MRRILGGPGDQFFSSCGLGRQFCGLAQGAVAMGRILGPWRPGFLPFAGLVAIFLVWLRGCRHGAYFGVAGDQVFPLAGLVAIFVVWLRGCRHEAHSRGPGDQVFPLAGLVAIFLVWLREPSPWGVFRGHWRPGFLPLAGLVAIFVVWLRGLSPWGVFWERWRPGFPSCGLGR